MLPRLQPCQTLYGSKTYEWGIYLLSQEETKSYQHQTVHSLRTKKRESRRSMMTPLICTEGHNESGGQRTSEVPRSLEVSKYWQPDLESRFHESSEWRRGPVAQVLAEKLSVNRFSAFVQKEKTLVYTVLASTLSCLKPCFGHVRAMFNPWNSLRSIVIWCSDQTGIYPEPIWTVGTLQANKWCFH